MDTTKTTSRDTVRPHKVNRAFGADYATQNEKSCYQASKNGETHTQGNKATLTLAEDGILKFCYNVETHTDYVISSERGGSLPDPMIFGYSESDWTGLLTKHPQINQALTATHSDRKSLLNNVVKERLMHDLHKAGVHADLLLAEGTQDAFTRWEQIAVCAAVTLPDLRKMPPTGKDIGRGIFGLPERFDHIEIAMLPSFDPASLFRPRVATAFLWGGKRHCLMIYKNVAAREQDSLIQTLVKEAETVPDKGVSNAERKKALAAAHAQSLNAERSRRDRLKNQIVNRESYL